jgi:uncharacterized protein (DUF362 family)/Pyruvate/2-oxoacid:ferredoxin oxidoreductase delta subunit
MMDFKCERGEVRSREAWTNSEIQDGVNELLDHFSARFPDNDDAAIVIKPNLNNDLVGLTGNSVDLRVLGAVLHWLLERGYTNLTVADGSNVGVERRGIDTFKRLRVDRLAERYGARIQDLNHDEGHQVVLCAGAHPRVARTVLDSDFLLSIPKIKTHAEAGLSCAMKNWVGIARGQEKRHMHRDLARNIFAINEVVMPDLVLVDGLIGMEGNGPGDGEPFRFGRLLASDSAFVNDAVVCRMVGLPWEAVPYLEHALNADRLDNELLARIRREIPIVRPIKRPPKRSRLAELSEKRSLHWLKLAARPLTSQPAITKLAYKLEIIQDVYSTEDDQVEGIRKSKELCGTCEKCADFCPTGLSVEEIGVKTDPEDCIGCMYCWWVCPDGTIELDGEVNHLTRQIERYKTDIEGL